MKRLTLIEMSFHSSSLSILTKAYQQLESVDVESDLEEFRNTLRLYLPLPESSPARAQSVPSIALPNTPTETSSKVKRSKSFSDYRQRAEVAFLLNIWTMIISFSEFFFPIVPGFTKSWRIWRVKTNGRLGRWRRRIRRGTIPPAVFSRPA